MTRARPRVLLAELVTGPGPYVSLRRLQAATRAALEQSFDLVSADDPFDAAVDLGGRLEHAAREPRSPTLVFAHGNLPVGATLLTRRRPRLKSTDVVVVNSTSDRAIFERIVLGPGPCCELLPFGVDPSFFEPLPPERASAARTALGVGPDDFALLYAGRVNLQKNLHSLLLLFRDLAAAEPRARLLLAGAEDSIPPPFSDATNVGYQASLQDLVRRWGLEERVRFLGPLEDDALRDALAASDVFVTLSLHSNENFGLAPVEAMAAGR